MRSKSCSEWAAPKRSVRSDNGNEFDGAFAKPLQKWRISRVKPCPYHPQGNDLAEATVKAIKKRLSAKLIEVGLHIQWQSLLPQIQFKYNRCPHSSTKVSPFELMFGGTACGERTVESVHSEALTNAVHAANQQRKSYLRRMSRENTDVVVSFGDQLLWVQPET